MRNRFITVLLCSIAALFISVSAVLAQERIAVKFSYAPNAAAQSVSVAGTFNEWNKSATPLKEAAGGIWEAMVEVPAGMHQYKFVINGEVWVADPAARESCDDGQGGRNSVVSVGEDLFRKIAAMSPSDDSIDAAGILHRQADPGHLDFTGEKSVRLILRTYRNDASLAYAILPGKSGSPGRVPMMRYASDDIYDYFKAHVAAASGAPYLFFVKSGKTAMYYGYKGPFELSKFKRPAEEAFRMPDPLFRGINRAGWASRAVFYQVFPDRFADGDRSANQKHVVEWGAKPLLDNFTGGDLEGIRKNLGHIKALGADAIYLNPIFRSNSNHKYDTIDYFAVDPSLGGMEAFDRLVKDSHCAGFRVVLDGVFNHTSTDFFAFDDARRNGTASGYAKWYDFKSFPVNMTKPNYECWWNIGSLPKLNIKNPDVYNYLLTVPAFWMKKGIDGFRLDVPNELPHSFWKDFRKIVRENGSDPYIVGEIWADGSPWLAGDQFDGVMNYKLRANLISFFVKKEMQPSKLDEALAFDKVRLPASAFFSMYNLLGSHDTPRILTVCGGDRKALAQMVAFVMCYPGAPAIYYGDEIGLEGDKDPDNRRCMEWDTKKWDREVYDLHKKLIGIRRAHKELVDGDILTLAVDDRSGLYSFARFADDLSVCAFNRSDTSECLLGFSPAALFDEAAKGRDRGAEGYAAVEMVDLCDGEKVVSRAKKGQKLSAVIPAKGFGIYRLRRIR